MSSDCARKIANAVLYEGYMLYPYRASALKNRHRWNFGGLCPRAYSEAQKGNESWYSQTQCLAIAKGGSAVRIQLRFLRLVKRQAAQIRRPAADAGQCADSDFQPVDVLEVEERRYQTWEEAAECEFQLPEVTLKPGLEPANFEFFLDETSRVEPLRDSQGALAGALIRTQKAVRCAAQVHTQALESGEGGLFRLTLRITNETGFPQAQGAARSEAIAHSMLSSHAILTIREGEFLSLLDPSERYAKFAAECENVGAYPVLIGEKGEPLELLSSSVILYDYPEIAPESPGDLFDSTEIDEILTLRILALTDQEKAEMRACGERTREILDRIESDPARVASLHGRLRDVKNPEERASTADWNPFEEQRGVESVRVRGVEIHAGDRVRLRPRRTADILDLALAGQIAMVEAIEQDYEDHIHFAVVLDDDPGRDLGELRQPGHRFFFSIEEIEPIAGAR